MSKYDLFRKRSFTALISFLLVAIGSGYYTWSTALPIAGILTALSILPVIAAALCIIYARCLSREDAENFEITKLTERHEKDIFAEIQRPARKALLNFSRYTMPFMAVLSGTYLIAINVWLWPTKEDLEQLNFGNYVQGAAFALLFVILAILSSFYFNGAAKEKESSWLKTLVGWSSYLALGWSTTVLSTITLRDNPQILTWSSRLLCSINIAVGIELIISTILDFYRPKRAEQNTPLLESRLLSLLSQPQNLTANLSELLDYQFGIQLSPTWFQKKLIPQCLKVTTLLGLCLWALTCFHRVEEGQQAIKLTLGKAETAPLTPGLHLSLPAPLQEIRIHDTSQLKYIIAGISHDNNEEPPRMDTSRIATDDVILWNRSNHASEIYYLLPGQSSDAAAAADMVVIQLPLSYRISNIYDFAFRHKNSQKTLQAIIQQELLSQLSSMNWNQLFGINRQIIADRIGKNVQAKANSLKLGIEVHSAAVKSLHPPATVCTSFDNIQASRFSRDAKIFSAEQNAVKSLGQASNKAAISRSEAEASRKRLDALTEQRRKRFLVQVENYRRNPRMYQLNSYLNLVEEHVKGLRKYILVKDDAEQNLIFDFSNDLNVDALDRISQ